MHGLDMRTRKTTIGTEEGELVSLIFLAIRKDLLGKSKVTKEHLANLNPFNRG